MIPKKLYHYREKPLEKLVPNTYEHTDHYIYGLIAAKPYGLWLSIEDYEDDMDWKSWCLKEEFYICALNYKHEVTLKEATKVLLISSFEEIVDFSLKYAGNDPLELFYESYRTVYFKETGYLALKTTPDKRKDTYIYSINWEKVKAEYDCIMIAPYLWDARLAKPTSWYYSWDCASGVIWNLECIEDFKLVEVNEYAKEEETAANLQM